MSELSITIDEERARTLLQEVPVARPDEVDPQVREEEAAMLVMRKCCELVHRYRVDAQEGVFNSLSFEHAQVRMTMLDSYWAKVLDAHLEACRDVKKGNPEKMLVDAEADYMVAITTLRERARKSEREENRARRDKAPQVQLAEKGKGELDNIKSVSGNINQNKNILNPFRVPYVSNVAISKNISLLPTALVRVGSGSMSHGPIRALLDTGAQPNLVSWKVVDSLKCLCDRKKKIILGIDGNPIEVRQSLKLKISPWFDSDKFIEDEFLVMSKNSNWAMILPQGGVSNQIESVGDILADPTYGTPREVLMILGVNIVARALSGIVNGGKEFKETQLETIFGLVMLGSQGEGIGNETVSVIQNTSNELDNLLERFWKMDEIIEERVRTNEEQEVEDIFLKTYRRDSAGRFIVRMPLKSNWRELGSSKEIALKRFFMLEKRLEREIEIREKYIAFMREYESMGHMQLVSGEDESKGVVKYYIPHHCVTAKFRVVFDASCKTSSGLSLNEVQLLGEKLQKDLQEIILRFRRHKIGIVADIKMMFRQVRIAEEQWNLQRIFWRERSSERLREYWLTVNTYGMTSAAHIAVRAMIQCAKDMQSSHPVASRAIINDMYMDDCVSGTDSEEEAMVLARDMDIVLSSAGFELRKWKSNSARLMETLDREKVDSVIFDEESKTKVLGLKWLVNSDEFTFKVTASRIEGKITKRKIVSCVAQLYDPSGFIAPVTIVGKILIQDMWVLSLGWDEEVPSEIVLRWKAFWDSLQNLERFRIPRWIGLQMKDRIEIHGFSDASMRAYGAVLYVRKVGEDGQVNIELLTAKSRVAPVKTVTIPRLELAAAEMLSKMIQNVVKTMEWKDVEYILWTDSMVTLHWLRKLPSSLKTFVANRVSAIQARTDIHRWRHVNSEDNPADLISRGLRANEILGNRLWGKGPKWLMQQSSCWPSNPIALGELDGGRLEEKVVHVVREKDDWLEIYSPGSRRGVRVIDYFGKIERIVNVIGYVFKYVGNLRAAIARGKGRRDRSRKGANNMQIGNEERDKAIIYIVKRTQEEYYAKELRYLRHDGQVQPGSKIEPLKPILDSKGILRVGGRIDRAELGYERKHQTIIPNGSRLGTLIMENAHRRTKHGATQVMTRFIRERFWLLKIRRELRAYIHKCPVCARHNQKLEGQLMADLPEDRVRTGKAFLTTGVDFAGPFRVRHSDRKGKEIMQQKCWVAVFVCLKTRAVHLDLVSDLTSLAFVACYERFIARRGRCVRMYSDNGTTFRGAEREMTIALKEWSSKEVVSHVGSKGTEWKFMTPAAPHQGGIYEAAVKSMKFHFKRIVGMRVLTYEQLVTLLTGIEAILNSRPLYPMSEDPFDAQALTPGHFLVGEPLVLPLPLRLSEESEARGVRLWNERKIILEHFWKVWQEEYLGSLQARKKWRRDKEPLREGQLVVIRSETMPPAAWALGRIKSLILSKDGRVRNVVVRTETTELTRPVQKICIIPMEGSQNGC